MRASRIIKFFSIGILILFLFGLFASLITLRINNARINDRLAAIRAAGEPASLIDLKPPPVPDGQDGAKVAAGEFKEVDAAIGAMQPILERTWHANHKPGAADALAIAAIWKQHPHLVPLLNKVLDCPRFSSGRVYDAGIDAYTTSDAYTMSDSKPSANPRPFSILAEGLAAQQWADGNTDQAIRTSLRMLRFASAGEEERCLISFISSLATREAAVRQLNVIIRETPMSPRTRSEVLQAIDKVDIVASYQQAMRGERIISYEQTKKFQSSRQPFGAYFSFDSVDILDFGTELIKIADKPYCETKPVIDKWPDHVLGLREILFSLLKPSQSIIVKSKDRTLAMFRCIRILDAIQERHIGPKDAVDLTRLGLPPQEIVDPFDGKTMKIKSTPAGWIIYSVGPDLVDNGGDVIGIKAKDFGLAPLAP
jgi:hypothetical protein